MMFLSRLPFAAVNLAGIIAFTYPFLLASPADAGEGSARSAEAPWLIALLVPLLLTVAISSAAGGRLDAKGIALLGVLSGLSALLRIPISFAGANLMFFLPISAGFVFGPSFGFLLGSLSMAASAAITGGLGPWLPFQMWAAGWIGAGAGLLRPLGVALGARHRAANLLLAAYGWAAGFVFGAVINLYFWPVISGGGDTQWAPGIGAAEAVRRYWSFYVLTSLSHDAFRALGNATVILIIGMQVVQLFRRYRMRFTYVLDPPYAAEQQPP